MATSIPADLIVGVDLGGTKILAAVVRPDGEILVREKRRTKAEKGSDTVLKRIVTAVRNALEAADVARDAIGAVGVGVPGPTDTDAGIVHEAPNLGWSETPVAAILSEQLGVPVFVGNDTNLCTLAEFDHGAGRGTTSMIGVFVGTGIGGGLILNGDLLEGATQAAGEIGHMIVRVPGPLCGCGRRGCMEAMASRLAIERRILEMLEKGKGSVISELLAAKSGKNDNDTRRIRSQMLAKAYAANDRVVQGAVNRSAWFLGVALAGAVHLINPQRIVIGGGVVEAIGQPYVDAAAKAIRDQTFAIAHRDLEVVQAELGDDAGVVGAACLVRRRLAMTSSATV